MAKRLQSWDKAAGGLLVREAGGLLNDFDGNDDWLGRGEIIATTPKVHHQMLEVLKQLSAAIKNSKDKRADLLISILRR